MGMTKQNYRDSLTKVADYAEQHCPEQDHYRLVSHLRIAADARSGWTIDKLKERYRILEDARCLLRAVDSADPTCVEAFRQEVRRLNRSISEDGYSTELREYYSKIFREIEQEIYVLRNDKFKYGLVLSRYLNIIDGLPNPNKPMNELKAFKSYLDPLHSAVRDYEGAIAADKSYGIIAAKEVKLRDQIVLIEQGFGAGSVNFHNIMRKAEDLYQSYYGADVTEAEVKAEEEEMGKSKRVTLQEVAKVVSFPPSKSKCVVKSSNNHAKIFEAQVKLIRKALKKAGKLKFCGDADEAVCVDSEHLRDMLLDLANRGFEDRDFAEQCVSFFRPLDTQADAYLTECEVWKQMKSKGYSGKKLRKQAEKTGGYELNLLGMASRYLDAWRREQDGESACDEMMNDLTVKLPQWLDATKILPNNGRKVVVTDANGQYFLGEYDPEKKVWGICSTEGHIVKGIVNVVAWLEHHYQDVNEEYLLHTQ